MQAESIAEKAEESSNVRGMQWKDEEEKRLICSLFPDEERRGGCVRGLLFGYFFQLCTASLLALLVWTIFKLAAR